MSRTSSEMPTLTQSSNEERLDLLELQAPGVAAEMAMGIHGPWGTAGEVHFFAAGEKTHDKKIQDKTEK